MTIALIDGDVLAYHACESRWKTQGNSMKNGVLYVSLDDAGEKIPEKYTKEEDTKHLRQSWDNFQSKLQTMLDDVFATDFLMAVKGPDNFRDIMYPIELNLEQTKAIWGYKANRWKPAHLRNDIVPHLRELAIMSDLAIASDGREADDMLRIWSNQAQAAGIDYVTCTVDKDLKCIPGPYYDMKTRELIYITPLEAMRHYYEQILKGDPTDNIPGIPGLGPKTAVKLLADYTTESDMQEIIVDQYIQAYADEWRNYLLANAKMIHLQNHPEDYFNFNNWPVIQTL